MLSTLLFDFSVGVGGFCHRTESDLFPFLLLRRVFFQTSDVMCLSGF